MAEGSAGAGLMDARQYLYLPLWVKVVVLLLAAMLSAVAGYSVYRALGAHEHGEAIVFFVSVAQSATLIVIFFFVVAFSRRDANAEQLQALTETFFTRYVAVALAKVSVPARSIDRFDVNVDKVKDIFGRLVKMTSGQTRFEMWVGLNVRRIFVIYFVPLREGLEVETVKSIFQFTFGGATKVGYACNYEAASLGEQRIASIWLTADTDGDLLSSPYDKLFWAQDIAMMTESFLRTAHRNGIELALAGVSPGPL